MSCSIPSGNLLIRPLMDNLCGEQDRQLFCPDSKTLKVKNLVRESLPQPLESNDEIVARIQAFANKVSLHHNGRFICNVGTGRGHKVITVEIKGDRTELGPVFKIPQDREDDPRKFDIRDTAYASHVLGKGDLIDPEPLKRFWVKGPTTRTISYRSGETITYVSPEGYRADAWMKQLGLLEHRWDLTREPFHAMVRISREDVEEEEEETGRDTWFDSESIEHPTQIHQKIANILERKIISLKAQNRRERLLRLFCS